MLLHPSPQGRKFPGPPLVPFVCLTNAHLLHRWESRERLASFDVLVVLPRQLIRLWSQFGLPPCLGSDCSSPAAGFPALLTVQTTLGSDPSCLIISFLHPQNIYRDSWRVSAQARGSELAGCRQEGVCVPGGSGLSPPTPSSWSRTTSAPPP